MFCAVLSHHRVVACGAFYACGLLLFYLCTAVVVFAAAAALARFSMFVFFALLRPPRADASNNK